MDRLLDRSSDLGLLSEELVPHTGRHAGNTPLAISHLSLVRAADAIAHARGTAAAEIGASLARSSRG